MKSVTRRASHRGYRAAIERAQVIVEFALVLPILLIVMVVALEWGLALEIGHSFSVAAREAAMHITSARSPESERTETFAEQLVQESLGEKFGSQSDVCQGAVVSVSPSPETAGPGTRITVTVTYPMNFIWAIAGSGSKTIKGESVFEMQGS